MNLKIGSIIKRLRSENDVTQEALANVLGVTAQAISRWESANGYPDIELLPALADFFSVSTDELLGYKLSEREEEIAKIKKEMSRLAEVGTIEERLSLARNAVSLYPSDFEFKENLVNCLYHLWHYTWNTDLVKEIENLCSDVIEDCKDENIRYDAIIILISIYDDTKQVEKAIRATEFLTPMIYCREFAKAIGIGDGNTELYIQDKIDKLTDCLGNAISNYTPSDVLPGDPSTWDKKIEMLNISNQLYFMIYGNDLMFYHNRIADNYLLISTYQVAQGKFDETLNSLEKMCFHAVEYDRSFINDHGKFYTSIFVDKLVYPEPNKDFHEMKEHSQSFHMLDRLSHSRYDHVRDSERFVSVVNKLKEYSR